MAVLSHAAMTWDFKLLFLVNIHDHSPNKAFAWITKLIFFFQSFGFSCPIQILFDGFLFIKLPTCHLPALFSVLYISLQKHKWSENAFPTFHTTRQHLLPLPFRVTLHPCLPALCSGKLVFYVLQKLVYLVGPVEEWLNGTEIQGVASLCSGLWGSSCCIFSTKALSHSDSCSQGSFCFQKQPFHLSHQAYSAMPSYCSVGTSPTLISVPNLFFSLQLIINNPLVLGWVCAQFP